MRVPIQHPVLQSEVLLDLLELANSVSESFKAKFETGANARHYHAQKISIPFLTLSSRHLDGRFD